MAKKLSKAHVWARGLAAAFISGGSGALSASFGANYVAPDVFNMQEGLAKMAQLALITAISGAVLGVSAYLTKSPLPEPEEDAPTS